MEEIMNYAIIKFVNLKSDDGGDIMICSDDNYNHKNLLNFLYVVY